MASQVMVIADSFAYKMVICKGKAASDCLKHYSFFCPCDWNYENGVRDCKVCSCTQIELKTLIFRLHRLKIAPIGEYRKGD